MTALQTRALYSVAAGTIGFSGTGGRTVTFTGSGAAIAYTNASGLVETPFGDGSQLLVEDRIGILAGITAAAGSTVTGTLRHDWGGSLDAGQEYRLYMPVPPEALIAGMLQAMRLSGSTENPFPWMNFDDGNGAFRDVAEGGKINRYVGLPGAPNVLAYSIDIATGEVSFPGTAITVPDIPPAVMNAAIPAHIHGAASAFQFITAI